MKYLGLDLGTRTLGLAMSDATGLIATSYKIIRHNEEYDKLIEILKEEIENNNIGELVLGFPKNMDNSVGDRALITLDFKKRLEEVFDINVILEDERLTSVISNNVLIEADVSRKKRKKKVDGIAAIVILQNYLDRNGG